MAKIKIQKKDIWIDMKAFREWLKLRYRKKTSGLT